MRARPFAVTDRIRRRLWDAGWRPPTIAVCRCPPNVVALITWDLFLEDQAHGHLGDTALVLAMVAPDHAGFRSIARAALRHRAAAVRGGAVELVVRIDDRSRAAIAGIAGPIG